MQASKEEMIDALYKPLENESDDGIIRNQRSTIATSVVAPICYAHHAAAQMGQLLNLDDLTETGLSPASEGNIPIPELPMLHRNVRSSMFFC
ncbi:hypothetical protein JHK85_044078 [Glycine max]|nr:hypothetical protein JHK85_044078 [Glycine max]